MLSFFVTGLPLHHLNKTVSASVIDFLAAYEDPTMNIAVGQVSHLLSHNQVQNI
jgi:hypothetical protein